MSRMSELAMEVEIARNIGGVEHEVAMDVTGLLTSVASVVRHSRDPDSVHLVVRDRDLIVDAAQQIVTMLTRIPFQQKDAAE